MTEDSRIKKMALMALNVLKRNMYLGTVSEKEIAKRRAKNKVQKRSRRINRKAQK